MAEIQLRGKSIVAVARDVAEGFFTINTLVLKKFDPQSYKALHQQLKKLQTEVRGESFPLHDALAIRGRNARLQRLHGAIIILEHSAKERKIML
ncbi:MAG: hypothetical protein HY283_05865 [Nitrospirae bacterium]|nr:hypothetical protein [Nitrospirota bacterium]